MKIVSPKLTARCQLLLCACVLILSSAAWTPVARAQSQDDLLLFLSLESFDNTSRSIPGFDNSYLRPTADILYAYNNGSFRFLGEYIWSSSESEMERFKLGWQASEKTMIWFGRFHTTAKYWTTEYHHGQFMQTSISRPGLEEWEDESGPMPSHITGVSIDHEIMQANQSALSFNFAAGLGPVFEGQELVPFDVLDPGGGHELSFNTHVAFRPDALSENQVGVMASWNDIPVISGSSPSLVDIRRIEQATIGVFADWRWDRWRLLTSWTYFDNDLTYTGSVANDDFTIGYIQGEYRQSRDWTIFGRTEIGFGEDNSPFLILLPAFIAHRHMLGLRWDYADKQSLTMEFADTSTQAQGSDHNNFKELRFQWSAVFP